jgi:hypothetical protein
MSLDAEAFSFDEISQFNQKMENAFDKMEDFGDDLALSDNVLGEFVGSVVSLAAMFANFVREKVTESSANTKFIESKPQIWQKIEKRAKNSFDKVNKAATKQMDRCITQNQNQITSQIATCLKTYEETVNQLIAKDEIKKQELDKSINTLRIDSAEIGNRRHQINALARKMGV